MTHTFKVKALNQPAVVERMLRVIRHRGFNLHSLNLEVNDEQLDISFKVESERAVNLLINQLTKLYDVTDVSVI